ncbi:mucin-3A-like [Oryx dammah]|uniref:mucin-3A-like n=1 Tax=Oryx dammah TaxID=59534 RepID=UPI001A9A9C6C|nr:mucin-3A-like [Oryx dammah]
MVSHQRYLFIVHSGTFIHYCHNHRASFQIHHKETSPIHVFIQDPLSLCHFCTFISYAYCHQFLYSNNQFHSSTIVQTSMNVPASSDSTDVSILLPATTQSTFMNSAGSSTSKSNLSFTLSLSGTSPPTTGNIPSSPTTHNTGTTSNIMTTWATRPSETSVSPNIQTTATPFLSTSIPGPSLGPSLMPSSSTWTTQAESITSDAISMSSSMQELAETTLAPITTDLYLYQSSSMGLSSTAASIETATVRDTTLLASSALRTTATPIGTVSVESLTTDITSISPITSSATQTSTVHFQTSPVSTPVTSSTLTASSSPVSFPSFTTTEPVPTETTAPTPLFTLPTIPATQSTSTPSPPTGTFTTTRTEVTTPTHTSPPATDITASSHTPSTTEAAKTGTTRTPKFRGLYDK